MNPDRTLAQSHDIATKVALLFRKRAEVAQEQFTHRLAKASEDNALREVLASPVSAAKLWTDSYSYAVDATQRSILFWDTIRERGNNFIEHTQAGLPPVLHFPIRARDTARASAASRTTRRSASRSAKVIPSTS